MKLRKTSSQDLADIETALGLLRRARNLLKHARCPAALAYVRRAMKSVEGAQRHAIRADTTAYCQEREAAEARDHERLVVTRG